MKMESLLTSSHLLGATYNHSLTYFVNPCLLTPKFVKARHRFSVLSYKSSFQDFQEYAKPRRLLPVRRLESLEDELPDKLISSFQSDGSQSLYMVRLRTSSAYGSDLSDLNAGVLICIIDEHGDSMLERIPAILCQDHAQHLEESNDLDHIHFRRGSIDDFMLWGPKLGRIQAIWISLESGSWRLGGASLTTMSICNQQAEECSSNGDVQGTFTYHFEFEDVMLGEGSEMAMAELCPLQVMAYSGVDPSAIPNIRGPSLSDRRRMNEDSMREYADLKFSLLLYDSMLIFAGTSISTIAGGENTALAFFTGGIGGFLYLLLLQRSVDNLGAPDAVSNLDKLFGGVKGPLLALAVAFGVGVIVVKHGAPDAGSGLAPSQIVVGVLGFLSCKIAVVLSALKPMSLSVQDNK